MIKQITVSLKITRIINIGIRGVKLWMNKITKTILELHLQDKAKVLPLN